MQSSRLPRFQRTPTITSIQLTERDREIIRLVGRHRFLHSQQIISLVGDSPQPLLRRLQLLYHHGYLERPHAQLDYYHKGGSRPMVYGLGNKGARLLKCKGSVRWSQKNHSVGQMFLQHALLVSEVMVAIELACRKAGVRLLIDEELPRPGSSAKRPSFKWHVKVNSRLKLGVIPDRVFALEFSDANSKPTRAFFFLEADRGTMPITRKNLSQTSFRRKLLAYEATWSQGLHRTRFGLHRFRVLTVGTSAARLHTIREECLTLRHGRGLFLFLHRNVLANPSALLGAVWSLPQQEQPVALLD